MRQPRRAMRTSVALAALILVCGSCKKNDELAGAQEAVRQTEVAWSAAAQAADLDRFASFYGPESSLLAPNAPIVTGAASIRQALEPLFRTPGFSLSIEPAKIVAARSGDLAYTQGRYRMTAPDPAGRMVTDTGKYVVVYERQSDGAWKVTADIFNSDHPASR